MMTNITIESQRLLFKRLSTAHVSDVYLGWLNDTEVTKFLEVKTGTTREMLQAYVEQQYENEVYFWAIHLKDTDKHIGNIKIDPINHEMNSGEYGIMIGDKASWGKGFAKEASYKILTYCFEELSLSKITLGVIKDNSSAVRLYEKMGFIIKEIKINTGKYDNKLCDSYRMVLNVEDFE